MAKSDFISEVLDIRVVYKTTGDDGEPNGSAEWRLMSTEDGKGEWGSYMVDIAGKVIGRPSFLPLPGSQELFLSCPVFEALYHGNRGPGKTMTLLMDFAQEVGKGYGKAWRGILFRRTYGDLDDVVRKIEEFFPKIFPGFKFLKSKAEYSATWPTGEQLLLRHMLDEEDYKSYHGHEYPWIGFEELTQWENDKAYKLMFSCCRPTGPNIPCRVRSTTNPSGVGHSWVKKRFRLPSWTNKVISIPGEVDRVAIQANLLENFLLLHTAPNYIQQIAAAATSPAQADAWVHGSWEVTDGGMFDDIWEEGLHVINDFPASAIPRSWRITRAYDHGQSHPFAVGWWLESNGESLKWNGMEYGRIRGDLILFMEWYGTTGAEQTGVRMEAKEIAQGILDREEDNGLRGRVLPGPADTEIWSKDSRGTGLAPKDDMEAVGVYWERADKSPGSRKRGWEMIRSRLRGAVPSKDGTREKPGLFVCRRCKYWLMYVPPTPRDRADLDDVPDKYEDHLDDMTRYRLNWEVPFSWRRSF